MLCDAWGAGNGGTAPETLSGTELRSYSTPGLSSRQMHGCPHLPSMCRNTVVLRLVPVVVELQCWRPIVQGLSDKGKARRQCTREEFLQRQTSEAARASSRQAAMSCLEECT